MPAWLHERAEHILAKNPSMPKSEAFAIATQQSHALGKSPKGYGTVQGRAVAKKKYKTPEDNMKKAHFLGDLHKLAFGTNTFSGPMNPNIQSGASAQAPPKRVSLQSVTQKTAELWPGFFAEMLKEAGPDLNVGQWWETVGGPFLAKGGDHKEFKRMMQSAGLPPSTQKKFEQVARSKYTNATRVDHSASRGGGASSSWSGSTRGGYEPPNPGYQGRGYRPPPGGSAGGGRRPWDDYDFGGSSGGGPGSWYDDFHRETQENARRRREEWAAEDAARDARQEAAHAAEKTQMKKNFINPVSMAGAAGLAGTTAYGAMAAQKEDPRTKTHEWQGQLGSMLRGVGGTAMLGYLAGAGTEMRGAGNIGAGIGAVAGVPLGYLMHHVNEEQARDDAQRAMRQPGKVNTLTQRAGMTTAAHMNKESPRILAESIGGGLIGGLSHQNAGIPLVLGAARHVGLGLAGKRRGGKALEHFDAMKERAAKKQRGMPKAAAGAPTRGNFMMASDIPAFKAPRLDRAIQKDADMLGDYNTYNPSDFKKSKYAMPVEALSVFVAELRKEAAPRWAKETDAQVRAAQQAHAAGDSAGAQVLYQQAEDIARRAGAGAKTRQVRSLGAGGDAQAHLMAGGPLVTDAHPLVAVKHVHRASGLTDVAADLRERQRIGALLPKDTAADLGAFQTNKGMSNPAGGLHVQEFLPYEATHGERGALEDRVRAQANKHGISDISDHAGNIRLDKNMQPKLLDARLGGTGHRIMHGTVDERFAAQRAAFPEALRDRNPLPNVGGVPASFLNKYKLPLALGGGVALAGGAYALHRHMKKAADVSPAVTWNGAQSNSQHQPSIIPPYKHPRLDRAIQKDAHVDAVDVVAGAGLGGLSGALPGGWSNNVDRLHTGVMLGGALGVPLGIAALSKLRHGKKKTGMMTPAGQLNKSQHVGAPKASAPPGPSIQMIARPKGPKFGTGIAGAFKNGIGGTAGNSFS